MEIKVYKDRQVLQLDNDVYGTQNENKVTTLKIEVPEQYENWNKRIVFLTEEGNKWDILGKDDTYVLQNNITKYEELEAYIWLTEKAEATEESVGDFRSEIFTLSFYVNENADDVVPDEKKIDGFNSMLTVLNAEIEEVKQINTDFTKLKQEVEQAETERNDKLEDAVNKITDLTEDYNTNAKKKVEEFDSNATEKIKDYNNNTTEKEIAYNNLAEEKENELKSNLDTYTQAKKSEINSYNEIEKEELVEKTKDLENELDETQSNFKKTLTDYIDNTVADDIKKVEYNSDTATFTFTRRDNTVVIVDLPIELMVKTGYYDSNKKELVLVLENNEEIRIPASGLIDDYTSEDTTTIQLVITADNKISANVKGQSISKILLTQELQEELDNKVNNTDIATTSKPGLVYATNSLNYGISIDKAGMLSLYKTNTEILQKAILNKQRAIPITSANFIESINAIIDSQMIDESENLVTNGTIKQYIDSKDIKYITTTETTKTINPNTFYDFGIVETLNITLAEITDTTIINEYMFQFETGTLATELTFTDTIKWIQNPTILPDKTYQVSIINNIGIMLEV